MGYSAKAVVLRGAAQTIGASITDQAITDNFYIPWELSTTYTIAILVASSTVVSSVVVKLQHRMSSETDWLDSKTVTITNDASDTTFHLTALDALTADQALLPLMPSARLVVSTGVGDSCVITNVWIPVIYT